MKKLMTGEEKDVGYNRARNQASSFCCRLDCQTFLYRIKDMKFTPHFSVI